MIEEDTLFEENYSDDDITLPNLKCFKKASKSAYNDWLKSATRKSYILDLYECLQNTLRVFCGTIREYLKSLDNVYDLLSEYTARVSIIKYFQF